MSEVEPAGLILTSLARADKIKVGPTAWVLLEELTLMAGPADDVPTAITVSVRAVARATGFDKDTAARALNRLVTAGLLIRRSASPAGTQFELVPSRGLSHTTLPTAGFVDGAIEPCPHNGDNPDCPHHGDNPGCPHDGDTAIAATGPFQPRRHAPLKPGPGVAAQLSLLDHTALDGGPS